ncbi:MAG TPA: hypothetical protein PLI18_11255 [Pirellulaceae bacterium]|nr:hypothetical protein [Pirellulaceae bacterium]
MFGKPEWFATSGRFGGLSPRTWQGWGYLIGWAGVIGVPTLLLLARGQWLESLVWSVATLAVGGWDLFELRRKRRATAAFEDLLVIGDQPHETATTDHYELQLRR